MLSTGPSYLSVLPVLALALAAVVLLCRWTFSTSTRDARRARAQERARLAGDWGLLTPVASVDSSLEADALRAQLRAAGLRATCSPDGLGRHAVLVFHADADRARALLTP